MAHELTANDAKHAIFAVDPAWHGLGTVKAEHFTAKEARKALGADVIKEQLKHNGIEIPGFYANVNTETGAVVGVVESNYTITQHSALIDLGEALVVAAGAEAGGAHWDTAFTMRNGARAAACIRMDKALQVKDDIISQYLFCYNTHDRSREGCCLPTGTRVVCANTARIALKGARNELRWRHTPNAAAAMEEARRALVEGGKYLEKMQEAFNFLADKQVTGTDAKKYIDELLGIEAATKADGTEIEVGSPQAKNRRAALLNLFDGAQMGGDMVAVHGTAYGLFQAVLEHGIHAVQPKVHATRISSLGGDAVRAGLEMKTESILFGTVANLSQQAFDLAMATFA